MMELRNSRAESPTLDQSQPIQKTDGDGPKIPADVGNAGGGGEVVKRKRGRPPRVQANQPAAKKSKEEDEDEDVCFICFDGGSLVLCDRRGCPKAYHPSCIKRDEAFFRSKAKWNCGWHICSMCEKTAYHMCYTCTYSLCKGCIRNSDYVCVRGDKGFCTVCLKTIMLIEKSGDATAQVDFDDKTSWEYLFKVYWVYTKAKLSLTVDELTQAKNPWKLTAIEPQPPTVSHTNTIVRRSITSELSNLEANESKRRKTDEQPNGPLHDPSLDGPKEWASKELLDLVSHMKNGDTSVVSQSVVQELLLEYINTNNLRDPRKKTQIICDLRLMNLFGKPRVGHLEMLKLLESHFLGKKDLQKNITNITAKQGDNVTESKTEKTVVVGNKERRNQRKGGKRVQNKLDEFAAIDVHNMNLIYLKRNLMESLIEDNEKFHEKAVGSIVQIRISGSDQKDDMYRLVQVVGTTKVDAPYKIGDKSVDIMLEVLNLDKKETVSIDTISNQELSEDECRRLRESIRCGLVRCYTVGEIQEKAMALQSVLLDDRIQTEMLRLNQLRDRASEKGQKKGVRECVQKLKILKTPEERERRLREIPEVHSDPKMNPDYESDDTEEYFNNEHGEHPKPKFPWVSGTNKISPTKKDNLNDHPTNSVVASVKDDSIKSNTAKDANGSSGSARPQKEPDCNGSNLPKCNPEPAVTSSSSSHIASESKPSSIPMTNNRSVNDDIWHYRDPSGNVQGPFSMVQLQKWSTSGYFPVDMRIWAGRETDSVLLNHALHEHFNNHNTRLPDNAASSSKDDIKVLTTSYALDKSVNLEKIPDDLNRDPIIDASLTKSTEQFGTQRMLDINQNVSAVSTVADASVVNLPTALQKTETRENQKLQPSKILVQDSGVKNTLDMNQHVSSAFTVTDAPIVPPPNPLQKKKTRKSRENQKIHDFGSKEQSKSLVHDSGIQKMPDINQHVPSGFTVTNAAIVHSPDPLLKKKTHENQKTHDSGVKEQSKLLVQDSGIHQKLPDINQNVSSVFTVTDTALVHSPDPLQKKKTRKTREKQKIHDPGVKEQSKILVQDSVLQNVPDMNQRVSSVFTVTGTTLVHSPDPLQNKKTRKTREKQKIHDSGVKEQPKILVQDPGIQNIPDMNQHISSVFTVADANLVDLQNPLMNKKTRENQKTHDSGFKEQSKIFGTQNMPDINQHVSSVFNSADAARVDLPNPLQNKETRENQKILDFGERSKIVVQDSGIQNMPDINQHISSVFTVADSNLVNLPNPSQNKETRENQKLHYSGVKEQSKILVQDSGIQNMPDMNQHISSVFTVADSNLVNLPNPSQNKETRENQKTHFSGVKEQSKLLIHDSGIQNMPDMNQHVSSLFTVADANVVNLPNPSQNKDSRENQKIEDSGNKEHSKLLVQDSGNPPSWSTTLSLVVGGTQLPEPGVEWGRYPPTIDHQVGATSTAIDQITHLPSWHGLGETIEFSTLAEESVSDLLAEVDAMESRNCVPSPTSRRNSFLEDLFNGSMDDFSPTTDQGTTSDGFSSAADVHLTGQPTGLQFSFGLETKPTCAVSIPQTSDTDHIGFKWAEMGGSELHPTRQDMFDLNDSTRAEADEGERETVIEENSTTRETEIEEESTTRAIVMEETRVGRKSKEKEGERLKPETARAKFDRGFPVVEEEEGEFIQPEAAPPPPPPLSLPPPQPPSLPLPLPPLLPLPRQPPLTVGLDAIDTRRVGSGRPSQVTTPTGRVHTPTGGSRSGNVGRDPHHRRHGGDRYHSNSNSPRQRSHHVEDLGYGRSSKPSWSRQSSFSGGGGGGSSGGGSGYSRPPPKGQRVCKYYESGRCNKGSACHFLHPQDR